jgi:hypothetical protein
MPTPILKIIRRAEGFDATFPEALSSMVGK